MADTEKVQVFSPSLRESCYQLTLSHRSTTISPSPSVTAPLVESGNMDSTYGSGDTRGNGAAIGGDTDKVPLLSEKIREKKQGTDLANYALFS